MKVLETAKVDFSKWAELFEAGAHPVRGIRGVPHPLWAAQHMDPGCRERGVGGVEEGP